MFSSALASVSYTKTAKKVSAKYSAIDMTTFMLFFGTLIFTGLSIVQHVVAGEIFSYFTPLIELDYLSSIAYLGLLSSLGSSFLSNYAIHHVEAATIGLFSNLSPVIMILSGVVLLGEPMHSYQLIGISIILLPIVVMNLINSHKKRKELSQLIN